MANKEVKLLLKAARSALDKQEYEEAIKHCEAVLWSDSDHYLANVITGKAYLLLGKRGEAKLHYKKATTVQPQEQLAWKGLADLYDKHGHDSTKEDMADAILAYNNILKVLSDDSKKIVTTGKLGSLYKEYGDNEQASVMYEAVLSSDPPVDLLLEGLMFLLSEGSYTQTRWAVLRNSYDAVLMKGVVLETNTELVKAHIGGLTRWVKLLVGEEYREMFECLREECERLLEEEVMKVREMATKTLCLTELWSIFQSSCYCKFPVLSNSQKELFSKGEEFSPCYRAIVQSSNRQIKEACESVVAATEQSPSVCEYWAVACLCQMMSHDYHMIINSAKQGLSKILSTPQMLKDTLQRVFHHCKAEALIFSNQSHQALNLIEQQLCGTEGSQDCHVTQLHVRALVDCNKVHEAEQVLSSLTASEDQKHIITGLKGLVSMANKDFKSAANLFGTCIKAVPDSAWYFYNEGVCLMRWPDGDKKQAYQSLIKAAQMDPFNPYVFLQLGHYQRNIAGDLRRASKCYQKSFGSLFSPVSAGIALGEVYTALGDEESAFKTYKEVISKTVPSQSKEAWLRVGLYHRKCGRYEEAIKCFLTVLRQNSADFRVWECIGEAYLTRGSQTSALKAFHRAVELNPESVYCQYQIASIQHLLGLLPEAIEGYTAVLNIDHSYVPALKGRAEGYFGLAQEALGKTFDGKAVDLVSHALKDLSRAVQCQPNFICLWKLIGDSCLSLCHVTPGLVRLAVPSSLMDGGHGDLVSERTADKQEILQLAISSYGYALKLINNHTLSSSPLLHNMSLAYYSLAKENTANEIQNLSVAFELIKKTVSLSPSNHQYWNTLGVIASHPLLATPSLAQHAFIKSILMEPNNAVSWANLGSLYLINDNIKLAHSAFEKAQSCDPTHVEGWVGDGLVAETIGRGQEAMNFFLISSELEYHPESALAFGEWVCHTLSTSKEEEDILSPFQVSLPSPVRQKTLQARDGLIRYVQRNPSDPCGLNLLGLLYEQEGLVKSAQQSISQARKLLNDGEGLSSLSQLSNVMSNQARLFSTQGEYSESLETFDTLNNKSPPLSIEYALALFRAGKFYEAAAAYEDLMSSVEVKKKPHLLLASAMAVFGDKNMEECKSKLFKVFQTPPPIVHGMISLAAFAGHSDDITLLLATLKEIEKIIEVDPSSVAHIHPSCRRALRSLGHYLENNRQAIECREAVQRILAKIPSQENTMAVPPVREILRDILSLPPDQSLATVQKIIHSHPGKQTEAKTLLNITIFKAQKLSEEVQSGPQLLQLKTSKLQTLQLLLSWAKKLNSILN